MGMWGFEAWDNDAAADWFGGLMDRTRLREHWLATMSQQVFDDEAEDMRAGVWLFAQLGRVYIWPIDHFDADLQRALDVADQLLASEFLKSEVPEYVQGIQRDRDAIAARQKKSA